MDTDMGVFAHPVSNSGMTDSKTQSEQQCTSVSSPRREVAQKPHHWPTTQLVLYLPKFILKTKWVPKKVQAVQPWKVLR